MTIDAAQKCLARLKASYQSMKPLDELTTQVYLEEIGAMRYDDFCAGAKEVVRSQKFFPSIAELVEAAEAAARKRFEAQDHVEREERLALMTGETAIMDPTSAIHGHIVGPNHQKFVDMISGKVRLPAPEWMSRNNPELKAQEIRA